MNDDPTPDTVETVPQTEPTHAPEPHNEDVAPEAEAGVEQVTEPDPEHAPEPAPVSPPELADVAPAVVAHDAVDVAGTEDPAAESESPKQTKRAKKTAKAADLDDAGTAELAPSAAAVAQEGAPGEPAETQPENKKKWYAIKVQSGREDTIKAAILRKVAIEGLEEYFGQILIPYEEEIVKKTVRVKDKKTGEYTTQEKKVTRKKKKFQGYLFAELEFNDRILYLFRETSGVGDFLNLRTKPGQQPTPEPMPEHEVQSMLTGVNVKDPSKKGGKVKVKLDFEKGDRVRIRDGSFANQEGEVKAVTEPKDPTDTPKVTVILTFWGRPLEVELDYWQVEKA
ncbi:transcription termination/antitermination protein NusG [Frigoriglobus tundricola]|uniref:Transcription termination/antitermination protein NusG n=1 Tax=Frigoriglobus tundricola TaxID=2774151 RepID=A0A6M5YZS7_9BACT|nr:transcription termination/antitermination protein NusG [Frigoriglobus tundricola]QJW99637.1 hypothetical protein FTUN_7256 [Frigoriglobus tundricola]